MYQCSGGRGVGMNCAQGPLTDEVRLLITVIVIPVTLRWYTEKLKLLKRSNQRNSANCKLTSQDTHIFTFRSRFNQSIAVMKMQSVNGYCSHAGSSACISLS